MTRFPVSYDGTLGTPTTIPLAKVGTAAALPGEPTFSADGATVYVPLNGQNAVAALDAVSGAVEHTWTVGTAPA